MPRHHSTVALTDFSVSEANFKTVVIISLALVYY